MAFWGITYFWTKRSNAYYNHPVDETLLVTTNITMPTQKWSLGILTQNMHACVPNVMQILIPPKCHDHVRFM